MSWLISEAVAAGTATNTAQPEGGFGFLIMMAGFFILFYFLLLRPQKQQAKEKEQLINSIAKGDEIVTVGGLLGKVTKVTDDFLTVNVAENVNVTAQRKAVATVLPKGTLKTL